MKNNRFISLILTAIIVVMSFSGCSGIKKLEDMKITSAKVEKLMPEGLRGLKLALAVGVDNPGMQVSVSDISCSFKHSGKILGNVAVEPFTLQARTEDVYNIDATLILSETTSLFDMGRLLDKAVLEDAVVDFSAKVKLKGGVSKKLVYNNVPLKKLLEAVK